MGLFILRRRLSTLDMVWLGLPVVNIHIRIVKVRARRVVSIARHLDGSQLFVERVVERASTGDSGEYCTDLRSVACSPR